MIKKINSFRIKWISYLINSDRRNIEVYLANKLISENNLRKGLHILKGYTERHVKSIKNSFYRNACLAWFKLVTFEPNDQRSVESLWIYDNILLKDDDGRVYKPPDHFGINRVRRDMPNNFKDLPFLLLTELRGMLV